MEGMGGGGGSQQTRPEKLLHWRCPLSFVYRGRGGGGRCLFCFVVFPLSSKQLHSQTQNRHKKTGLEVAQTDHRTEQKRKSKLLLCWAMVHCYISTGNLSCYNSTGNLSCYNSTGNLSCYNSTGNLSCYNSTGNLWGICRESRGNQLLIKIFH